MQLILGPTLMDPAQPDDLTLLLEALQEGKRHERLAALQVLGAKGVEAAPAVSTLVDVLRDSDVALRAAAADALARIGQPAVMPLLDNLQSEDPDLRKALVITLGKIGPAAVAALPVLAALINDDWLGTWASTAVRNIQGKGRWNWLKHPGLTPRWLALWAGLIALGGIWTWYVFRSALAGEEPEAAVTSGVGLAILGVSLGVVIGLCSWDLRKGAILAMLLGLGGGMAGLLLGGLFALLVEPVNRALGR